MKNFLKSAGDVLLNLLASIVIAVVIPTAFFVFFLQAAHTLSSFASSREDASVGGNFVHLVQSAFVILAVFLATILQLYLAYLSVVMVVVVVLVLNMTPGWKSAFRLWLLGICPEWLFMFLLRFESKSHKEKRQRDWDDFLEGRQAEPENGRD